MFLSREKNGEILFRAGIFLVIFSLLLFFLIFYPVVKNELQFLFSAKKEEAKILLESKSGAEPRENTLIPASLDFALIISKIGANEKVIANVNPFDQGEYLLALKEGIAHAQGSALPDEGGSVFLFAHSSGNFYQNSRLNTAFLLLNKLEKGDRFSLVYKKEIFEYEVFEKKIVTENEVEYIGGKKNEKTATLMTCWPPGTSFKRLLVLGKQN